MDINQGHYVIYLQNMKFVRLILWPGGAYTDNTYTTTTMIMIPYYDSFHESWLYRLIMAMPNEPKSMDMQYGFSPHFHINVYKISGLWAVNYHNKTKVSNRRTERYRCLRWWCIQIRQIQTTNELKVGQIWRSSRWWPKAETKFGTKSKCR